MKTGRSQLTKAGLLNVNLSLELFAQMTQLVEFYDDEYGGKSG